MPKCESLCLGLLEPHAQVVANWANNGMTLKQSIDTANTVDVPASYPRWPGENPGWTLPVLMPNGTQAPFKPDTCLKFAGFAGLMFSGVDSYNNKADWQQP
jgi:hypothetical protein